MRFVTSTLVTVAILGGLAANAHERPSVAAEVLLAGTPIGEPAGAPRVSVDSILAISPEMQAFLETWVNQQIRDAHRLDQLVDALISSGAFRLSYDDRTRTAAETFAEQQGNCLSFSIMFIAMARQVGLDARFQEVEVPPDWALREDLFVLNRHVNVLIDLGVDGSQVVDFNIDDFKMTYDRREISDRRALAHYANNMGVEAMEEGNHRLALAYFRGALSHTSHRFSPAWNNLGSLYLRTGHPTFAEAAFLHALAADQDDPVAMSNLVRFYDSSGDHERASTYRSRVHAHRMHNPYYRYRLAVEAFEADEPDDAIGHLRYALRRKPYEDRFMFLLGASLLQAGNERKARRWMDRAREMAATKTDRNRYSSKIEALLAAHARHQQNDDSREP